MSQAQLKITHAGCVRALELIRSEPGLQRGQISQRIGCGGSHTGNILHALKAEGLIGAVPIGGMHNGAARGWYAAEALPKAIADRKAEAEAIRKKHSANGIAKMQRQAKMISDSALSGQPVHRLVNARSRRPLPFKCTAPNSVFALGVGK